MERYTVRKKVLAIFLCLIIVNLIPITVHADPIVNYNGFYFDKALGRINSIDGTVSGDVVIPNTIEGVHVSSIHEFAFYNKNSITSITLPKYLIELPDKAFYGCSNLQNVYFESGSIINKIGDNVFQNCSSLRSINLPDTVQEIGEYAFNQCYMLHSFTIPSSVSVISDSAFKKCGLRDITIPSTVTEIDYGAFSESSALKSVTVETPSQLVTIGGFSFDGCSALTDMDMPEGLKNIGGFAFRSCSSLEGVTLPSTLASIGSAAFYGYNGDTIELPHETPPLGYQDKWQTYFGTVVTAITSNNTSYTRLQNAIDYSINYNYNDSSNDYSGINPTTYNIETEIVLNNLPNRANATFAGWYTQWDFTPSSVITSIPTGNTGNINLYAKWIKILIL